jgi:bifunctional non-homologous end joining protein LigD
MAPIEQGMSWDRAHIYTRQLAERLADTAPDRYVTSAALAARPGRLFIDYLRNGRGTTAIGAFSPRARPGFPVAAPVTWEDIESGLRSDAFSMQTPPPHPERPPG